MGSSGPPGRRCAGDGGQQPDLHRAGPEGRGRPGPRRAPGAGPDLTASRRPGRRRPPGRQPRAGVPLVVAAGRGRPTRRSARRRRPGRRSSRWGRSRTPIGWSEAPRPSTATVRPVAGTGSVVRNPHRRRARSPRARGHHEQDPKRRRPGRAGRSARPRVRPAPVVGADSCSPHDQPAAARASSRPARRPRPRYREAGARVRSGRATCRPRCPRPDQAGQPRRVIPGAGSPRRSTPAGRSQAGLRGGAPSRAAPSPPARPVAPPTCRDRPATSSPPEGRARVRAGRGRPEVPVGQLQPLEQGRACRGRPSEGGRVDRFLGGVPGPSGATVRRATGPAGPAGPARRRPAPPPRGRPARAGAPDPGRRRAGPAPGPDAPSGPRPLGAAERDCEAGRPPAGPPARAPCRRRPTGRAVGRSAARSHHRGRGLSAASGPPGARWELEHPARVDEARVEEAPAVVHDPAEVERGDGRPVRAVPEIALGEGPQRSPGADGAGGRGRCRRVGRESPGPPGRGRVRRRRGGRRSAAAGGDRTGFGRGRDDRSAGNPGVGRGGPGRGRGAVGGGRPRRAAPGEGPQAHARPG